MIMEIEQNEKTIRVGISLNFIQYRVHVQHICTVVRSFIDHYRKDGTAYGYIHLVSFLIFAGLRLAACVVINLFVML